MMKVIAAIFAFIIGAADGDGVALIQGPVENGETINVGTYGAGYISSKIDHLTIDDDESQVKAKRGSEMFLNSVKLSDKSCIEIDVNSRLNTELPNLQHSNPSFLELSKQSSIIGTASNLAMFFGVDVKLENSKIYFEKLEVPVDTKVRDQKNPPFTPMHQAVLSVVGDIEFEDAQLSLGAFSKTVIHGSNGKIENKVTTGQHSEIHFKGLGKFAIESSVTLEDHAYFGAFDTSVYVRNTGFVRLGRHATLTVIGAPLSIQEELVLGDHANLTINMTPGHECFVKLPINMLPGQSAHVHGTGDDNCYNSLHSALDCKEPKDGPKRLLVL